MYILVSNHAAEIAAFRSALGSAAATLQVAENNLSALSLIGNRHDQIDALVITEHQDQAVNVDTEVFVQNIVPRLLGSTEVVVIGALVRPAPGVQLVETIAQAAALVVREAEPVAAGAPPVHGNGHAKLALEALSVDILPHRSSRRTKQHDDKAAQANSATAEPAVVEPAPEASAPEAPSKRQEPPKAQPPRTAPDDKATVLLLPRAEDDEVYFELPAQLPPAPLELPAPQVLPEIPELTRSLADDIRDWTEHQDQQRGQDREAERRRQPLGELLLSWLPGNRRLREQENELDAVIRQPRLTQCHSVAVISPKGGVGKSFLTYLVGNFLAEVRGDKVIAIDTNPDFGTLADQVRGREEQTVSTLLEQIRDIRHYSDLRRFTSKVESRLEVLAAPADPDMMATITANEYGQVFQQLHHYYDTVMFDCGTGFRDDITRFALQTADQIVLVSAPLFITTGIVIRAIGYLDQIGCDLGRVTLAINQVRREKPLDIEYMRSRFGSRLNAIVEVPFDMQLYQAMDRGEFSVEATQQPTRIAVKQLVGELVRHFH